MTGTVHGTADDGVYTITLDNEGKRNALTYPMLGELRDLVADREGSDDVIVLRGAGDAAFSAGADLTQDRTEEGRATWNAATEALETYAYPTIAMINGHCYGGAVYLAGVCDLRVATAEATFGVTPAKIGIVYPPRSIERLVDLLGPAHTKELLFTGASISADRAAALGLVNRVVPDEDLEAAVDDLARGIAGNAPLSLRHMKRIVNAVVDAGSLSEEELAWGRELVQEGFASRDYEEGRAAFAEDREPEFEGR